MPPFLRVRITRICGSNACKGKVALVSLDASAALSQHTHCLIFLFPYFN
jgi:hypothetical protein